MSVLLPCENSIFILFTVRHLQIPALPAGLQIMADQGFANRRPLLLLVSRLGIQMPAEMER